jgi:hypothetical protein
LTDKERAEFNEMLCGSMLSGAGYDGQNSKPCWNLRDKNINYLVYDGETFRCANHSHCCRVTPHLGKLTKWTTRYAKVDSFKVALINRKIKSLKNTIAPPIMKLVKDGKKYWIEINGQKVSPKRFSQNWWTYKFERIDV